MNILAIDTSQQWLNLVFCDENRIISFYSEQLGNQHAEKFVGALDQLLLNAHAGIKVVNLIAVTTGPGSFTGLRVGISFAKGLAMALDIKCLPLNTLDAMAAQAGITHGTVAPMIDAKKGQVYTALYNVKNGNATLSSEYCAVDPAEWLGKLPPDTAVLGSGAIAYKGMIQSGFPSIKLLDDKIPSPTPESIYKSTIERLKQSQPIDLSDLQAFYVRPADAELKPKNSAMH